MAHRLQQIMDQDEEMIDAGQEFDQLSWQGPDEQFGHSDVIQWNRSYLSQQWHPADNISPPQSVRRPSTPMSEATREKLREAEDTLRQIQCTASNAAMLSGFLDRPQDEQFYLQGIDNVTADLSEVLDILKNRKRRGAVSEAPPPNFKVGKRTLSQPSGPMNAMVRRTPIRSTSHRTDVTSAPREIRRPRSRAPSKGHQTALGGEDLNYEGLEGILDPDWENKQKLKRAIDDLKHLRVNLALITKEYDNMEDLEMANAMWDAGVGRSREPDWNPEEQPVPPMPVYVDRRNQLRNGAAASSSPPQAAQGPNSKGQDAMEWQGANSSPAAARAGEQQHEQAAAAGVYLPSPLHVQFARQSLNDNPQQVQTQPSHRRDQLATPENNPAANRELFPAGPQTPMNRQTLPDLINPQFTQQFNEIDWDGEGGEDEYRESTEVQPIPFRLQMPRNRGSDAVSESWSEESEEALPRYDNARAEWDARRVAANRERMRQQAGPARTAGSGRGGARRQHPYGRPEPRRR